MSLNVLTMLSMAAGCGKLSGRWSLISAWVRKPRSLPNWIKVRIWRCRSSSCNAVVAASIGSTLAASLLFDARRAGDFRADAAMSGPESSRSKLAIHPPRKVCSAMARQWPQTSPPSRHEQDQALGSRGPARIATSKEPGPLTGGPGFKTAHKFVQPLIVTEIAPLHQLTACPHVARRTAPCTESPEQYG